ncbi:MAG: peptidase [Candidatus Nitrosotenuis sp.]|nr:MAG: peptidase [Candidatus Nitrosotenuis sp.]
MKSSHALVGILSVAVFLSMSAHSAFGHGVGFETLPPKMLGDRKVAMEVSSTVDNSTNRRQVTFSMFDTNTGITIRDVTYHVKTIKNNNVVFEGDYETGNGGLVFDLAPAESDKVTAEEKNNAGFFDALIGAQKNTVEASGKIFRLGGLYKFSIDVLSAEGYSSKTNNPVHFDAGISFPEPVKYTVNDAYFGKQDIRVITYYDLLDHVGYDSKTRAITFSMPFEWSIPNINQTSIIHEEVSIPKTFGSLQVSEYSASVNGIALSDQTLTVDDFSKDNRIVHILLYQAELSRLYGIQDQKPGKIDFALFPKSDDFLLSAITENVEYRITLTATPKKISAGDDVDVSFKIYDVFLQGKTVSVPYDFSIVSNGKEIFKTSGTSTDSKDSWDVIHVSMPKDVTNNISVRFENVGGNKHARAEIPIAVIAKQSTAIPHWIKNDAKWWCTGFTSDNEFLSGMEYLVRQNVIHVSEQRDKEQTKQIPEWIKTNSCSWANDSIPDDEFLNVIAYLIKNGIIKI